MIKCLILIASSLISISRTQYAADLFYTCKSKLGVCSHSPRLCLFPSYSVTVYTCINKLLWFSLFRHIDADIIKKGLFVVNLSIGLPNKENLLIVWFLFVDLKQEHLILEGIQLEDILFKEVTSK